MDPARLWLACERNAEFGASSQIVVIRHGRLIAEWNENHATATARFDVWSATKSFTSTTWGVLLFSPDTEELRARLVDGLDTRAYELIADAEPLTDDRKAAITLRHLLSMTSGIPGVRAGINAIPTDPGVGPFEAALGHASCKAPRWPESRSAAVLSFDPGTDWDYSDPAWAHLSLAFVGATGQELREFLHDRVLGPIGIRNASWDSDGGGGSIGPHTKPHTGLHISARELARFGYLMLRRGRWGDRQLVPEDWVKLATRTSQDANPTYGYGWWVNTSGVLSPGTPRDHFLAWGYHMNECHVIPSLDLVVARTGNGPPEWDVRVMIEQVADAVVD